ncbi:tetratricopeptide repeat protein [Candidatus Desantisbacteria bacterium]|nr:tetratricopeptide repeat protein [Candidatus Desantisbacteria bacterium]
MTIKKPIKIKNGNHNTCHYLPYLSIVTISILIYINILWNGFVYDDFLLIIENKRIQHWQSLFDSLWYWRPVNTITLMLDYSLWELKPVGYHLTNIVLHALASISVYLLINTIIKNTRLSLIIGLVFAAHPLHTEAVAPITHRQELLSMIFYALSFIFYIRKNISKWYFPISLIAYILAVFSKEVAAIGFPLMLIVYDLCFNKFTNLSQLIKKNIKHYIPYGIVLCLFVILHMLMLKNISGTFFSGENIQRVSGHQTGSYFSLIYTTIIAFPYYIKLLIFPYNLCLDYTLSTPHSILEPDVILSLGLFLILISTTILSYRYSRILFFGLSWFFLNWFPVSNLIPLSHFFIAERYMYVPSLGFCLILGMGIERLYAYKKQLSIIMIAIILIVYSGLTIHRNLDYKSEYTIWSKTVKQNPKSTRAHMNLGIAYAREGLHNKAIAEYLEVLKINPNHVNAHDSLGVAYMEKGLYNEAIEEIKKVIKLKPDQLYAYNNLGIAYEKKNECEKAIALYKKVLNTKSINYKDAFMKDYAQIRASNNLGVLYEKNRQYQQALQYYKNSIQINPDYAKGYENLTRICVGQKEFDNALEFAKKAAKLNPTHFNISNLACLYYKKEMYQQAEQEIKKAIKIAPSNKNYPLVLQKIQESR